MIFERSSAVRHGEPLRQHAGRCVRAVAEPPAQGVEAVGGAIGAAQRITGKHESRAFLPKIGPEVS